MKLSLITLLRASLCLFILAQGLFALYAASASPAPVLYKPGLSVIWNSDTTNYAKVVIIDSAVNQSGYRIYRADGFSSPYTLITQLSNANLANSDTVIWLDSTIPLNSWANYKVAVFAGTDSLFSAPCSTYSFHSEQVQQVVTFTKLSDFPIFMNGGLSALAGDSLILKDSLAPALKYSAINVKDPAHPKFDGYVDSTALLSYPVKTLLPVFLKYGVANSFTSRTVCSYKDKILVMIDSVLKRYQIQNNNLILIDTLKWDTLVHASQEILQWKSIYLLDTVTLAVLYETFIGGFMSSYCFRPISLAEFSALPFYALGINVQAMSGCERLGPNVQGIINNRIFVSVNDTHCYPVLKTATNEMIYDLSLNQIIGLSNVSSTVTGSNTGCFISATEALSTTGNDFFVSDVRNLHSYEFASANNGVYRDTVGKLLQNSLLDTAGKKIYLVFSNDLTILSYQREIVGVANALKRVSSMRGLSVRPGAFGTTIVLPDNCRNADLFIYDVSGRIVERMRNITSNAVIFRPKSKSANCYVAVVRNEGREYSARFMTR